MIWRALNIATGLATGRPAASALNKGYGYYATDTGVLSRSNGSTWDTLGGGAPSGSAGGDLTGTYPNPTLAAAGSGAAGPVGSATVVPIVTVDAKGRVTALSSTTIAGSAPGGTAGGALDGTYPNPGLAAGVAGAGLAETSDVLSVNVDGSTLEINSDSLRVKALGITDSQVAAANKDGTTSTPSLRTLGTTGVQAAAGNDSRLSDSRAPNGSAGGDLTGTYPNPTLGTAGPGATGPIGSATVAPIITIDAKGRVTALSSATITGGGGGALAVIDSTTLLSDTASYDLTGIAATYQDLVVRCYVRGTNASNGVNPRLRFNNDSGASQYDTQYLLANATTVSANTSLAQTSGLIGDVVAANGGAGLFGIVDILIPAYAQTTGNKEAQTRASLKYGTSAANFQVMTTDVHWRSSAAINRITIFPSAGQWLTGSSFVVYGRG